MIGMIGLQFRKNINQGKFHTVWNSKNFSAIQIFREINFGFISFRAAALLKDKVMVESQGGSWSVETSSARNHSTR